MRCYISILLLFIFSLFSVLADENVGCRNASGSQNLSAVILACEAVIADESHANSDLVYAWYFLGSVAIREGDANKWKGDNARAAESFTKAAKYYSRILDVNPGDVDALINRSIGYGRLSAGSKALFDQAQGDVEQAISLDPKSSRAFRQRADLKLLKNDVAGAQSDLERARDLAPKDFATLFALGSFYSLYEKYDLALASFNEAIAINSKNSAVFRARGLNYQRKNMPSEASMDMNIAAALEKYGY